MKRSSFFYSILFLLAFGLFTSPVWAQTSDIQTGEGVISPLDDRFSEGYDKGYQEGFNAGLEQGRMDSAGRVDTDLDDDGIGDSSEIRGYRGAEDPERSAPETTGGRWHYPGVNSNVDQGGPDGF